MPQKPPPDPAQLERDHIQSIDTETGIFRSNLQRSFSTSRPLTSEELAAIIDCAKSFENYYLSYEPVAAQLAALGFANLSRHLAQLTKETAAGLAVYQTMYQSAIAHPQMLDDAELRTQADRLHRLATLNAYMEQKAEDARRDFEVD